MIGDNATRAVFTLEKFQYDGKTFALKANVFQCHDKLIFPLLTGWKISYANWRMLTGSLSNSWRRAELPWEINWYWFVTIQICSSWRIYTNNETRQPKKVFISTNHFLLTFFLVFLTVGICLSFAFPSILDD